jgi:hypothetical protein
MEISPPTLSKHYREELDTGKIQANAKVAEALFNRATKGGAQAVTAMIFWLKCQAGWKETSVLEHVGDGGGAIAVADARTELAVLIGRMHEAAKDDEAPATKKPARKRRARGKKRVAPKRVAVRKKKG